MPDARPEYRRRAVEDPAAIFAVIAEGNPARALSCVADIEARCTALSAHPRLGRARDDLLQGPRLLTLAHRVLIADRVTAGRVEILRVFTAGQAHEATLRGQDDV